MHFAIISIFPQVFRPYVDESILGRAQREDNITISTHDLRNYTQDKHRTVDDTPFGGGAGMVMKVEPIYKAVRDIQNNTSESRVILLSAKGKQFTQREAERLASYDQLIFICGRYEGVDERVAEHIADEEISIGPYVLTGGELPAMIIVDAVSRLLPGVLGNTASLEDESHGEKFTGEYPQYTRPAEFNGWTVPEVLQNGNHAKIEEWKKDNSQ